MNKSGKIFAGPRLKRFRKQSGLTQADMANDLEVSSSYLNLMEHNQRPLTAAILLKLVTAFGLDLSQFDTVEEEQLIADLEHVFSDPILAQTPLSMIDRKQMAMEHPDWAEAFIKLYRAYRRGHENLNAMALTSTSSSLTHHLQEPLEEMRDFFAANHNYFHALDSWAEHKALELDLKPGNRRSRLVQAIHEDHGYRVLERPSRSLAPQEALWDPHHKRLTVSLGIPSASKAFRIAQIYCRLSAISIIEDLIVQDPALVSAKAKEIAVGGLINYAAAALVMPYNAFLTICQQNKFDVDSIADHLGLTFEQAAHRLSTMHRPGASAPPFFFLKIDSAGNVLKRLSNGGFGFPRHGNLCPAWSIFKSQRTSGETMANMIALPSGQRFLCVAQHSSKNGRNATVVIGCEQRFVRQTAYAEQVMLDLPARDEPIGPTCKLCSRQSCPVRAQPLY